MFEKKGGYQNSMVVAYSILILVLFGVAAYYTQNTGTQAELRTKALMVEFNLIQPLPGATRNNLYSGNKGAGAYYRSNKSYKEIRSFYSVEASKNGWEFFNEVILRPWGNDFDRQLISFRKGDYILSIEYVGEKANNGWDFSVGLSWKKTAK